MEKILFLGGVGVTGSGFVVIFYQALMFLQHNEWRPYSLLGGLGSVVPSFTQRAASFPAVEGFMRSCPLSAALIVIGLIMLWAAGRIRNRYA